jgi:hypothetical protein
MTTTILPQSSVRRKRVTAMVMASSIRAIVSYSRFGKVAPFQHDGADDAQIMR